MNYATPADILNACADYFGIPISTILGDCRAPDVVLVRRAVASLARQMTTASFPEIARVASRSCSHASVIQRIVAWRNAAPSIRDDTERFVRGWLTARGLKAFDRPQVGGWQAVDFIRRMDKLSGPHHWDRQEQHAA